MIQLNCPICGKPVPASKGVKPRKFCSSKCAGRASTISAAKRGYRKPKNFRHVCLFCGRVFFSERRNRSFYCSRECANNAIAVKRTGKAKSARLQAVLDRRERKRLELENCRETATITVEERDLRNSELGRIMRIERRGFCPIASRCNHLTHL